MESQDGDDEDRVVEVITPVDATTRRCADDVELSCAPLSLHRGSSETACRAASRSARQAVAKQLDRQENGVSLLDALVAKSLGQCGCFTEYTA